MTATLSFKSNVLRAGQLFLEEIEDLEQVSVSPRDTATIARQTVTVVRATTALDQISAQHTRHEAGTAAALGSWLEYLRLERRVFQLRLCGCVLRALEVA